VLLRVADVQGGLEEIKRAAESGENGESSSRRDGSGLARW
jgi:hypothetical protein